ncbi:MAG: acyl-CoA reductase [Chitinophagales bacterium]
MLKVSETLNEEHEEMLQVIDKAYQHNKWFTPENISLSIQNIRKHFLDEEKLKQWLSKYELSRVKVRKMVGIVMAGNLPLGGFHDFLCVFLSGHKAMIKLSSKDAVLFPFILKKLFKHHDELRHWISISEIISGMEAAIATGSNNSSRYFQYYFGKYPHIIRKNRNSVAVLDGNETKAELENLGLDIFSYFGLGCRNVSKLFIPENYSFDLFFQSIEKFRNKMEEHHKYKNNYDYNRVLLLMNHTPFLTNDFLIIKEDERISSPVAVLHYEFYGDEKELNEKLKKSGDSIQCVAGKNFLPFGTTQSPQLEDYADGIDTMKFLVELE